MHQIKNILLGHLNHTHTTWHTQGQLDNSTLER